MKKYQKVIVFLSAFLLFCTCNTTNKGKVIFIPDPDQNQTGTNEVWQIIESQNGPGDTGIPVWVRLYLDGKIRDCEMMDAYSGKYVFVGENRGENLKTLQQWADGFTVAQDLPRLIAQRAEQRFTASASLYPDDEYGDYFVNTIKKICDEEYPGAVKEQVFWLKRERMPIEEQEDADFPMITPTDPLRYEFLVLISIDKDNLQTKIHEIMENTRSKVTPTRSQTAAITKINNTFFEGF